MPPAPTTLPSVDQRIMLIRGKRVMIDADLAALYGVNTKAVNQAVKRNRERFPPDFMFRLTPDEKQQVVTNCDHLARLKFSATVPQAFTEHGALMLGNVLNSPRAAETSVLVVRAFVRLREMVAANRDLALRLAALERKLARHDQSLASVISAIRQMTENRRDSRRSIGFTADIAKRRKG